MFYRNIVTRRAVFRTALISSTAGALALLPIAAQAQDAQGDAAEATQRDDIIVTATRRSSSVQDVPLAVAVMSGSTLQQHNVTDVQSLTRLEPSVVVNNQGVSSNQFIIRGIVSDIGSTTGFYLDESPLVGAAASESQGDGTPGIRLHDIERVEVLKGPQGTLFGSGSMAGTLRIITNKPKLDQFEAGMSTSLAKIKGGSGFYQADGYTNVPVSSTIAVRAVVWGEWGGQYIDHKISLLDGSSSFIDKNVNKRDLWGGRLSVLFQPVEEFSLLLQASGQMVAVDDVQYWTLGDGPYTSSSPTRSPFKDDYQLYSATANYKADFGTFTLIGSYGKQKTAFGSDSTQTGLALAESFHLQPFKTVLQSDLHFDDYTVEGRFSSSFDGPLQIVTGGFYQRDKSRDFLSAIRANEATGVNPCTSVTECESFGLRPPGFSAPGVPAADYIFGRIAERTVRQWAIYGQVDLKLADTLTATAGARYYRARISDFGFQIQDIAGPPDFAVPVPVPSWAANGLITDPYVTQDDRSTDSSPSYNFSLLWEATPDVSFFGRVASGFRIGGNNNATLLAEQSGSTIPASFESDKLWSYELGAKFYALNRNLFIDASIYQMDWSNQQVSASDPTGAFVYTMNAGKTRIRGAEVQMRYTSDFGLSLGGGITYTDAKLTEDLSPEVLAAGTIGYKGDRVPRVPRWTAAGQVAYEASVAENTSVYIQTDFNYRSSSTNSFNDLNQFNTKLPSFFLLGARAGVRAGAFDLSVYAENLTNKAAIYGVDPLIDGIRVYSPNPRTMGFRVSAHF